LSKPRANIVLRIGGEVSKKLKDLLGGGEVVLSRSGDLRVLRKGRESSMKRRVGGRGPFQKECLSLEFPTGENIRKREES